MKRLIFALFMTFFIFVLLNFVYCNLGEQAFGYPVVFRFNVPGILALQTSPVPMGFVILLAFCTGMLAIALMEALPAFFKTLELRAQNKRIRQLERELSVVKKMNDKPVLVASAVSAEPEQTPKNIMY